MNHWLIIQHEDNVPADHFGRWWLAAGVALHTVCGWQEEIPQSMNDYAALVVLGGGMNCMEDQKYPWLSATRELIKDAVAKNIPTLGICLGHQLINVALGGAVGKKATPSMGLVPTCLTEVGQTDSLLSSVKQPAQAIQYNYDAVTIPAPGAEILAIAPDEHIQALRFNDQTWGVQFHPECSTATFLEWTLDKDEADQPTAPEGEDLDHLCAEVKAAEPELIQTWQPLALRFMELVKQS